MNRSVPSSVLHRLEVALGPQGVVAHDAGRRAYASAHPGGETVLPGVVVLPGGVDDVRRVMTIAKEAELPVVVRGAASGPSGGAVPREDGLLIVMSRMQRILELDAVNRVVLVEPGVRLTDINRAAAPHGLCYAPEPPIPACTVGACIAEDSGGARSVAYGFASDHVLSVQLVTTDAEFFDLGQVYGDGFGFDLRGAVVGSEGTLGVVTRATLRLVPLPEARTIMVAEFEAIRDAARASSAALQAGFQPSAMELLNGLAATPIRAEFGAGSDGTVGAVLIVELDGPFPGLDDQLRHIASICRRAGGKTRILESERERDGIWVARQGLFEGLAHVASHFIAQDAHVPRSHLAEVLGLMEEMADAAGIPLANIVHVGQANLHPVLAFDGTELEPSERAQRLSTQFALLCERFGGAVAGARESGGLPRWVESELPPTSLELMRRVRRAFDPGGRANPSRELPLPRLCAEVPGQHGAVQLEAAELGERPAAEADKSGRRRERSS